MFNLSSIPIFGSLLLSSFSALQNPLSSSPAPNDPASLFIPSTPQSIKSATGLHLLTYNTPNGQKAQVLLEELHAVYNTTWTTTIIDFGATEQKSEYYLRLNPNGRIPTLLDASRDPPHPVMESSAILLYLVAHYDPDSHFSFTDPLEYSEMLQWLFFWHGSGAPYQGNLGYFQRQKEKMPAAIARFRDETLRIFGVLEIRLSGKFAGGVEREYLAGQGNGGKGKYSVADVGTWTWVKGWARSGFTAEEMEAFPSLLRWIERVGGREAVKRGIGEKYEK
jgi:glutathione S-transferase